MKKIILGLLLMVGTVSMAQDKQQEPFYTTDEYQQIKNYYVDMALSGVEENAVKLRKQFLNKIGKDNFVEMSNSGISIKDWLEWIEANIQETQFETVTEVNDLLAKMYEYEKASMKDREKLMSFVKKMINEVGQETYTKKLQTDIAEAVRNAN